MICYIKYKTLYYKSWSNFICVNPNFVVEWFCCNVITKLVVHVGILHLNRGVLVVKIVTNMELFNCGRNKVAYSLAIFLFNVNCLALVMKWKIDKLMSFYH